MVFVGDSIFQRNWNAQVWPAATSARNQLCLAQWRPEIPGRVWRSSYPADANYMQVRVEQTITLTLTNLPPHLALKVSFDLYVLKSWDGNSPRYGPDQWRMSVFNGRVLLDS